MIEEFLDGPEVSLFAVTDGTTVYPLQPAQDFKRIFDGDAGPNTGGMGAYTPLPWAPAGAGRRGPSDVSFSPPSTSSPRRGTPFSGLLYAGLALTSRGVRVIEFNARFGDPETQPLLALLDSPLSALLMRAATGKLAEVPPPALEAGRRGGGRGGQQGLSGVVVAAGDLITGVEAAEAVDGCMSSTRARHSRDGHLVTAGGRVLAVVGTGAGVAEARAAAYAGVAQIRLRGRPAPHRHRVAAEQGTMSR